MAGGRWRLTKSNQAVPYMFAVTDCKLFSLPVHLCSCFVTGFVGVLGKLTSHGVCLNCHALAAQARAQAAIEEVAQVRERAQAMMADKDAQIAAVKVSRRCRQ